MGLRKRFFALTYDRQLKGSEEAGLAEIRAELFGQAAGDVLEVGAGTGLNLQHYGDAVTSLTLVEPDPSMLKRLNRAVARSGRNATVLRAPAEDLPFDDESFDVVVSSLLLCGVDDQPRAARQLQRVLRPGGRLLFMEHVRNDDAAMARKQDRINWLSQLVAGCDCNRPTLETIEHSGLVVDEVVRGDFPKAPTFVRPLIHGRATRPVTA